MVMTPSQMLALGTEAPPFRLPDTNGNPVSLDDYPKARAYLVVFMCNHCPFVQHMRGELAALGDEYRPRGVAMFGINSNDVENYPDDSPAKMKEEREKYGYSFPYLFDESQEVAKAYAAACTPDFYLFDANRRLAYRGQLDDSRPNNCLPVTGADLRAALETVLDGGRVPEQQQPSIGCNIKWKAGNEPAYFG